MLNRLRDFVLFNILLKGEKEMMAMLFAQRVILGKAYFNPPSGEERKAIPAKLRQAVAEILIEDCGLPELVPAEYGGTAE